MPITFHRYGLEPLDPDALSAEAQEEVTRQEFLRQQEAGELPADAIDGGFIADTATTKAVRFRHRPAAGHLLLRVQPGDRICVTTYDVLMQSHFHVGETLEWARAANVGLVFVDLKIDSSTEAGRKSLGLLATVNGYQTSGTMRRLQVDMARRRAQGLVSSGEAPLGYQIKTIIPLGGGKPMKYYLPWDAEREYGERIVAMHDEQGMSFPAIAVDLWKRKICQPRSRTGEPCDRVRVRAFYRRCKAGWPLHGGVQWKPPIFKYTVAKTIDFNKIGA